ncbi:hypothetical protein D3C78_1752550 [compost metagenome]
MGHDRVHARQAARCGSVDSHDARMRVRTAENGAAQLARHDAVGQVAGIAGELGQRIGAGLVGMRERAHHARGQR